MCIIVVKNQGVDLPQKSVLQNCFTNNPDGCGYMYADGKEVHIRKGFMTFKAFEKDYDMINEKVGLKDKTVVYHFRISTQAGVNRECTHPYPLSKNMKNLKKLYLRCDTGIAHNGIISLTSSYGVKDHNDTMEFITDYLSLIIKNDKFYEDKDTIKLIERLCGSKLAILDKTGHCTLVCGNSPQWKYDKKTGLYFSNSSYEERTFKYGSYKVNKNNSYYRQNYSGYGYRSYFDDDYDDYDMDAYNKSYNTTTDKDKEDNKTQVSTFTVDFSGHTYEINEDYLELEYEDMVTKNAYYSAIATNTETGDEVTLLLEKAYDGDYEAYDMYE